MGAEGLELVIMRHGRIPANEAHRYAGATDEALTPAGRQDALEAGVHPEVARVYVSPKLRARQTAEICFPGAEQVVVEGLAEMDFGDFEGRSADEMYGRDAEYTRWVDGGCLAPCPNGESRDSFTARVAEAVSQVVQRALSEGGERAIVVGHGGTVMAAMNSFARPRAADALAEDPMAYYSWHVGNCGGYRARVSLVDGIVCFTDYERFEDLSFLS